METKAHITNNSGSMDLKTKRRRNKVEPVQQNIVNPYAKCDRTTNGKNLNNENMKSIK